MNKMYSNEVVLVSEEGYIFTVPEYIIQTVKRFQNIWFFLADDEIFGTMEITMIGGKIFIREKESAEIHRMKKQTAR